MFAAAAAEFGLIASLCLQLRQLVSLLASPSHYHRFFTLKRVHSYMPSLPAPRMGGAGGGGGVPVDVNLQVLKVCMARKTESKHSTSMFAVKLLLMLPIQAGGPY